MVEIALNTTDPTVPELPMGDGTETVVNLPAHTGETPLGMLSPGVQKICNDTATGEIVWAEPVRLSCMA